MGLTRKASAAFDAVGGSHGQTPAQQTLVSLLELAYGTAASATAALEVALALSGHDELPEAGPEIVAFVRAHLSAKLADEIGPRMTMALLDDLVARLDPASPSPSRASVPPWSMPRPVKRRTSVAPGAPEEEAYLHVLLVDGDRVNRTTLARAVLRAKWQVTIVETLDDLAAALTSGEPIDAAIVDAQHPSAFAIVEKLAAERRQVVVVARSVSAIQAGMLLSQNGLVRAHARSRDAPPEELIAAVRRLWVHG